MSAIRQFVILAGGSGTRLSELTQFTPKPLMEIAPGRVFLDYLIENAARQKFRDILIVAGRLGSQIADRYHNASIGGADVAVVIEPAPRGAGGALAFVQKHLAGAFLAVNGDTFFDVNFRAVALALDADPQLDAAIALRRVDDAGRYGAVEQDNAGRVTHFAEKTAAAEGQRGVINGGVYALRRRALARLTQTPASLERDLFPQLAAERKLAGVTFDGYFIDIGQPKMRETARRDFARALRPVLFLDRDGVLNHDTGYLYDFKDWRWIEGARDAVRMANDAGVATVVVTNQAGVARGKFDEKDVCALHATVQAELMKAGGFIDAFYYCPYHPQSAREHYQVAEPLDRKPSSNLLLRAARQLRLDLGRSLFVGDQDTDRQTAEHAGVPFLRYETGDLAQLLAHSPAWKAISSGLDAQTGGEGA